MGLYLTIFDNEVELGGVEIGSYDDFFFFRNSISRFLESGQIGARFPVLMKHSDCDGVWSSEDSIDLEAELKIIEIEAIQCLPIPLNSEWQIRIFRNRGMEPRNLFECYIDIEGNPLLRRLIDLAKLSQDKNLPILFQ